MAIGDLLGKLKGDKAEAPQFLAIELTDEVIQAAVWKVVDGKTDIVTTGSPVEWDGDEKSTNELLSAADATVSSALEGLGQEPDQVIFGIESSWVEDGKISPNRLTLIKQICKSLELKPLGFVEIIDSVIRYLKMQEGTPSTSIMIQVLASEIVVTLVRLGRIEASETVGRSEDIVSDVEEAIASFKQDDNLPSRILVFNSMHGLDDLVQNLVSYEWQKNFKFLHIPRVEALPKDVVIRAVAVGGGSEVAKSIGFDINEAIAETPPHEAYVVEEVDEVDETENVEVVEEDTNLAPVEDLGTAADFGFGLVAPKEEHIEVEPVGSIPEVASEETPVSQPKLALKLPKLTFPKIKFPSFKLKSMHKSLIFGIVTLLLLIIAFFSFTWFVPKAIISVFVESRNLDESLKLTLSTSASGVDSASGVIPAEVIKHTVKGEDSISTSGKKTIGDPAVGEVIIYNRTGLTKTLNKGTVLSASSLKFTLDDNVTIASKSAGSDYVDVPGKASVKITASTIGDKSNLPAGTEFTVATYGKDTYVGKNDSALKGGNSKEIQVVGKEDKASLVKTLLSKLSDQAKSELQASVGPGTGIYILNSSAVVEEESYSAEVGSEGTSLIGTLDISVSALKYKTEDVENLVSSTISKSVPPGYQRTLDPPQVEIGEVVEEDEGLVETQAKVIITLLPLVDVDTVANTLRGNSVSKIGDILASIPGYKNAEVEFIPRWLPTRFQKIPRNPGNILIKLQSE